MSSEFFASYCPCLALGPSLGFGPGLTWATFAEVFVLLCAQASVPAQLLSQFSVFTLQDFVPVSVPAQFWEHFFALAQFLHQVYGGGILAVIMHHRNPLHT